MLIKPPKNLLLKNIIIDKDFYKNYEIDIDDCLVNEIKGLWKKKIHTNGCCCGHNKKFLAHIIVERTDYQKMLDLGYEMVINEDGLIYFIPKSKCKEEN